MQAVAPEASAAPAWSPWPSPMPISKRDVGALGQDLDHLGAGEVTRLGGDQDRVWLQRAGSHEGVGRSDADLHVDVVAGQLGGELVGHVLVWVGDEQEEPGTPPVPGVPGRDRGAGTRRLQHV